MLLQGKLFGRQTNRLKTDEELKILWQGLIFVLCPDWGNQSYKVNIQRYNFVKIRQSTRCRLKVCLMLGGDKQIIPFIMPLAGEAQKSRVLQILAIRWVQRSFGGKRELGKGDFLFRVADLISSEDLFLLIFFIVEVNLLLGSDLLSIGRGVKCHYLI